MEGADLSGNPEIRKMYLFVEETHADGVKKLAQPTRKAAAAAVFKNPYADQYQQDLSPVSYTHLANQSWDDCQND